MPSIYGHLYKATYKDSKTNVVSSVNLAMPEKDYGETFPVVWDYIIHSLGDAISIEIVAPIVGEDLYPYMYQVRCSDKSLFMMTQDNNYIPPDPRHFVINVISVTQIQYSKVK